jgi:hypothetical protein
VGGEFAFTINDRTVKAAALHASDAAALSPAVALQLSVDVCGRTFDVDEREANAAAISFSNRLSSSALSREWIFSLGSPYFSLLHYIR